MAKKDDGQTCVVCGKKDNGPFSGEALMSRMETVHSRCYRRWVKNIANRDAAKKLNEVFAKIF